MTINKELSSELEKKLIEEKARLEKELVILGKPTGAPGDFETKFEDIGTNIDENTSEVEGYVDNLGVETNLEQRLKEVNEALGNISDGTYGICMNCNQEIDPERLRAYPAAKACIKCK